jgi:hypothetical protein
MAIDEAMRPFVQIATICQSPLQETSGFLSLIRIVDRVPVGGLTDDMPPQPLNQLFIVVVLKSGPMRGKYKCSIVPETPSRKRLPGLEMNVLFEGEERGIALVSPLTIVAEEEGLYWFDVILEQDLLTRIPLRVMYQKLQQQPGMPFQPPQAG